MTAPERLTVSDLAVTFPTDRGRVPAVSDVSFSVDPGEIVGLVGESGCGKSTVARSLVRLEHPGRIERGTVRYGDTDLTTADEPTLRRVRARALATVFQDPSSSLNPAYTIEAQIAEAIRTGRDPDGQPFVRELLGGRSRSAEVRERVVDAMASVGIARPEERLDAYPHELSGGLCQRVMLAIALARRPSVLIADEPTTALDTTTQAAILARLAALNDEYGTSMVLISHDLGVVSELCDRVVVVYDGTVVERGSIEELLDDPNHPYTKSLLGAIPRRSDPGSVLSTVPGTVPERTDPSPGCVFADRCPAARDGCHTSPPPSIELTDTHRVACDVEPAREAALEELTESVGARGDAGHPDRSDRSDRSDRHAPPKRADPDRRAVVELEGVTKSFRPATGILDRLFGTDERLRAVRDVSLRAFEGETLGLVGESGCGKSTIVRLLAGLETPTAGTVSLRGEPVGGVDARTPAQRSEIGVVFQNPGRSINPRQRVGRAIVEPLREDGWSSTERTDRLEEVLSLVELPAGYADRSVRQLSGGEVQRVAIARAIALRPSILLLDEPTASLDASVQATVLNLLGELQERFGLTYLVVSHDLDVVRHVSDRVAVMYLGRIVEVGPGSAVFDAPTHPYTGALLEAVPGERTDARFRPGAGEPPSPMAPPSGCSYHPRCPVAEDDCSRTEPSMRPVGATRTRCLYPIGADDEGDAGGESSESTDEEPTGASLE